MQQTTPAPAAFIRDGFTTSLSSFWWSKSGSWSVSSGKVSPTGEGEAILLASPDVYVANYSVKVTVPAGMADSKAGLVLAHDGDDTYYAVVFTQNSGLKLYHVVDDDWGDALKTAAYYVSAGDYTLRVSYRQGRMEASLMSTATPPVLLKQFDYDISPDFGSGYTGLYTDYNQVQFDNFQAFDTAAFDPQVPRIKGLADAPLSGCDAALLTVEGAG